MFQCNAIAEPAHEITWSFTNASGVTSNKIAGTDTSSTEKYSINQNRTDDTFGELTVNSVVFDDRGTYSCLAENRIGEEQAEANLTVHGQCWSTCIIHASSV